MKGDDMKNCVFLGSLLALLVALLLGCQSADNQPQTHQQTTAITTSTQNTVLPFESTPTTQAPSELSIPCTTALWVAENCRLDCKLTVEESALSPGNTIHIVLEITNAGADVHYNGSLQSQFGSAVLKFDGQPDYQIKSTEQSFDTDDAQIGFSYREKVECRYTFQLPDEAPMGSYILEICAFDMIIPIDGETAMEVEYMRWLSELSEQDYVLIWGADAFYTDEVFTSDSFREFIDKTLIYGDFDDVFVFFTRNYGSTVVTYDHVNGLKFVYGSTSKLTVCTQDGWFSLGEAFEKGILSAEQLQKVYDNYYLLRPKAKPVA